MRQRSETSPKSPGTSQESHDSAVGLFLRIMWLIGAFGGIALTAAYILRRGSAPFTSTDVLYWFIVALAVGARWLDILRYDGTTADGRPATKADGKRYTVIVVGSALAAWVVAHLIRGF